MSCQPRTPVCLGPYAMNAQRAKLNAQVDSDAYDVRDYIFTAVIVSAKIPKEGGVQLKAQYVAHRKLGAARSQHL